MDSRSQLLVIRALAVSVLIALAACGSHGGSSGVSTTGLNNTDYLRLRWFPLENADSYFLQVDGGDGSTVLQEDVQPTGCTHQALEGYTSGVCSFEFKKPENTETIAIQLGARTEQGLTNPSLLRYHPID